MKDRRSHVRRSHVQPPSSTTLAVSDHEGKRLDAAYDAGDIVAQRLHQLVAPSNPNSVVEDVVHEEPTALPDPSDEIDANEMWARGVKHLIQDDHADPDRASIRSCCGPNKAISCKRAGMPWSRCSLLWRVS